MAGKPSKIADRRLHYALGALSKNTLIDLVTDFAMRTIGADESEESLATAIQEWLDPVVRLRGDKPVSLIGLIAKRDRNDEDYRNKTGRFTQVPQ